MQTEKLTFNKKVSFVVLILAVTTTLTQCVRSTGSEDVESDDVSLEESKDLNVAKNERELRLPELALACGGNGHRNLLLVFNPATNEAYRGSRADRLARTSQKVERSKQGYRVFFNTSDSDDMDVFTTHEIEGKITYTSNYTDDGDELAAACFRELDEAKYRCAAAGNVSKCIEARYPHLVGKMMSGSCSATQSMSQELDCDRLPYVEALSEIRQYAEWR